MIVIDVETRSRRDLKRVGGWKYALDPSTECLCLVIRDLDDPDGKDILWVPKKFDFNTTSITYLTEKYHVTISNDIPEFLRFHLVNGTPIIAHNAEFEMAILHRLHLEFGWPSFDCSQFIDTKALCAKCGLPLSLESACSLMGLSIQKDMEGAAVMKRMAKPKPTGKDKGSWYYTIEDHIRLIDYCSVDVAATGQLALTLPMLSEFEQEVWVETVRINQRGLYADRDAISKIIEAEIANNEKLGLEVAEVTEWEITGADMKRVAFIRKWLEERGVVTDSLDKESVSKLLAQDSLPEVVRRVLEFRQLMGRSATAKYATMQEMMTEDNRMRGTFVYCGASKTGRFAGSGIQPHNLVRPAMSNDAIDSLYDKLAAADAKEAQKLVTSQVDKNGNLYPASTVFSSCIRGAIMAPEGKTLMAADYSAIEARGVFWLADCKKGMDIFAKSDAGVGPEPYIVMAADIFGTDADRIQKSQRQVGKQAILGCGYGMSGPKFEMTCEGYRIQLPDPPEDYVKSYLRKWERQSDDASADGRPLPAYAPKGQFIVDKYRSAFPEVVQYWDDCGQAALIATKNWGMVERVGQIAYKGVVIGGKRFLLCRLPSGRSLYYYAPSTKMTTAPWGGLIETLHYECQHSTGKGGRIWTEVSTYGAHLVENICQGVCRDLLVNSILNVRDTEGLDVVLHVHDEVVVEVYDGVGKDHLKQFERLVARTPSWANGFPVEAAGWIGKRYRKD